jgi:hypothetical protein
MYNHDQTAGGAVENAGGVFDSADAVSETALVLLSSSQAIFGDVLQLAVAAD